MTLFTKGWPLNDALYQTIRKGLKLCLKFLNMLPFWRWEVVSLPVEPACLMTTSCRLSISTYSVYWQLPSQKDAVPHIRDRTTRPTVVRRHSSHGVKRRDVGVCLHCHGLPRNLVHNFTGFNYLRGHFLSHRSVCTTGSAVLGFL